MRKRLLLAVLLAAARQAQAAEEPPLPAGLHYCSVTAWPLDNGGRTTVLNYTITEDGTVVDPVVVKPSGKTHLDSMALDCARRWKYRPGSYDGIAVAFQWQTTVTWGGHPEVEECTRDVDVTKEMLDGTDGVTRIAFKIMPDGSIEDAEVRRSSGNKALDEAALRCVNAYRYDTTHVSYPPGGYPNDATVDWHRNLLPFGAQVAEAPVALARPATPSLVPLAIDQPHRCDSPITITKRPDGPTIVTFTVRADGTVRDASLHASSGNARLDAAALGCAAAWRYRPATDKGVAVEMAWHAVIDWRRRN